MASLIWQDFIASTQDNTPLVAICILKGGHQFFCDLLNGIKKLNASMPNAGRSIPIALEFIKIQSYHNDQSSGQVEIQLTGNETWEDISKRFKGKHLLVVEDIIDTGRTMSALMAKLKQMNAASVRIASLFIKRVTGKGLALVPDYAGFSIPDKFIVGYCLDYNEYFRDLDHVCVINENGKQKYAE